MPRPDSPFRFIVSDLLRRAGERRVERITTAADWGIELSHVSSGEPLEAEVLLESASGGVYVSGEVHAVVEHTCHRCTATWREPLEVSLAEMLASGGDADYVLDGELADLEPVVRDTVVLALPLVPTCRESCLGLCATCGADLNTGACPGHDDESSSPFAGLRELLEP